MTLNERIEQLEQQIKDLTDIINTLVTPTQSPQPYTVGGRTIPLAAIRPADIRSGLGATSGNAVVWNSLELNTPPANSERPIPGDLDAVRGYNRHSHSRISGGALEANTLEIVELDFEGQNPHNAQYWQEEPSRQKTENSHGETVEKLGKLALVFNPDTLKWGVTAYEIDVKNCYFVQRDEDGEIELDENDNEMKSPLWNEDSSKSCIVWDKNAKVWRLYAVYAGELE